MRQWPSAYVMATQTSCGRVKVAEGGGWQPRPSVPTSRFWLPRGARKWGCAQNLGVGRVPTTSACTNLPLLVPNARCDHGLNPANRLRLYQPLISGCCGGQKVGVGTESGGQPRANHVCQPRLPVPTSRFWPQEAQKVRVGTEPGGRQPANHVSLYQPPLLARKAPERALPECSTPGRTAPASKRWATSVPNTSRPHIHHGRGSKADQPSGNASLG